MIRVPYRWTLRTFHRNVLWIVDDFWRGVANVVRWAPVIWYDADFDWEYLANVMEYKLRRMSDGFDRWGHHVNSKRDARQTRVCAELLARLRADDYWKNAQIRFGKTSRAAQFAQRQSERDKAYLGEIIGKYLNHWWD